MTLEQRPRGAIKHTAFFRRALIAAICAVALLSQDAAAQSGIAPYEIERIGQSGWQFLKINADARQGAVGGAFGALAGGNANDVFGNPAALAYITDTDLAINRAEWIADVGYHSASIARKFGGIGVVAVSVAMLDYGEMAETVNSPIEGQGRTEAVITGNSVPASDIAAGVGFAREITDRLAVGGNVRWIREKIAEVSMSNWSLDFGTSFYTGFRTLRIAFTARNFGPDSRFLGYSEEFQSEPADVRMPVEFRFSTAMDFFDGAGSFGALTISTGAYQANDGPAKINFGAEYRFAGIVALRGGYRFNYDEQDLTLGAGFEYALAGYRAHIDYAYLGFGALGQVHMFSLGIRID